jgi:gibberellin 20-oxidase
MDSPLKFQEQSKGFLFDSVLHKQAGFPKEFLWPDLVRAQQELSEPLVDLEGFFKGDEEATQQAANIIKDACSRHGFFQVINHGVDPNVIRDAEDFMDHFFRLPVSEKLKARRMPGSLCGYSGAHADRYASKLPWKETLSFLYHENSSDLVVLDFFKSTLGNDFEQTGYVDFFSLSFYFSYRWGAFMDIIPYSKKRKKNPLVSSCLSIFVRNITFELTLLALLAEWYTKNIVKL